MDRKDICEKRKAVYTFLAHLLLNEPTNDMLRNLVSNRELLREIADDQSLFTTSLDNKTLESFVQEYYDRFFVTSSTRFIPPFEYAIRHRTENEQKVRFGKLLSKQSFHIADCYAAVGLVRIELTCLNLCARCSIPITLPMKCRLWFTC